MGTLVGASQQSKRFPQFTADGTITTGGIAQLVLPQISARSLLMLQNPTGSTLSFEFGGARATATVSGGVLTGFTITNVGFNYTLPPVVRLFGGGYAGNSSYLGLGQPGGAAPDAYSGPGRPAKAYAVLTSSAVAGNQIGSFVIEDPGAGYVTAPYVYLDNDDLDPYGCALPSASSGLQLGSGTPLLINGTSCFTDAISVVGATTGQAFVCRWMQ